MHYSRHRLTAGTRQPMTSGLPLLVHRTARQKLSHISSVQLRRSVRTFTLTLKNDLKFMTKTVRSYFKV